MTASFDIRNVVFGIRSVLPTVSANFGWIQLFFHGPTIP